MKTIIIVMQSSDYEDPNIDNLKRLGMPASLMTDHIVNRTSIVGRTIEIDLKEGELFTSSVVLGSITHMYLNVASVRVNIKYDLEELIRKGVITSYSV